MTHLKIKVYGDDHHPRHSVVLGIVQKMLIDHFESLDEAKNCQDHYLDEMGYEFSDAKNGYHDWIWITDAIDQAVHDAICPDVDDWDAVEITFHDYVFGN